MNLTGYFQDAAANAMDQSIAILRDTVASLDRILRNADSMDLSTVQRMLHAMNMGHMNATMQVELALSYMDQTWETERCQNLATKDGQHPEPSPPTTEPPAPLAQEPA